MIEFILFAILVVLIGVILYVIRVHLLLAKKVIEIFNKKKGEDYHPFSGSFNIFSLLLNMITLLFINTYRGDKRYRNLLFTFRLIWLVIAILLLMIPIYVAVGLLITS